MRVKNIYILGVVAALLSFTFIGCKDDIDPLVEDLQLSRALSPIALEARIRNRTTIELNWTVRNDIDHYIVEFSEDSLEFNSIIRTVTVLPDELPLQQTFFGDTRYSARVKAVSAEGAEDSKWTAVTIRTDSENIFSPLENADIGSLDVTLKWPAGSEVDHFIIIPGDVNRTISAGEKTAGEATIDGLTDLTNYTIVMYLGNSVRGTVSFKTLVDPDGANTTKVNPGDDLSAVVGAAPAGQTLVLYPGDYTSFSGTITIDKAITIRGLYPWDKPLLNVAFSWVGDVTPYDVEVGDLELDGTSSLNTTVNIETADVAYGSFTLDGCIIHDFVRQLIYGNNASTVQSFIVDNCIVSNFVGGGGDFIDFRKAYLADLSVTNSTFNNCPSGRDFIRIDAASGYTATGLTTNVLVDHCTLYGVSNTQDRIVYVRFDANTIAVTNTLIADTDAYFSNQGSTSQPTCSKNNYFNAVGFYTPAYVSNAKIDESGNYTTLDPGFADAASGDFTISNQTLIDNAVGDPRWRP